MSGAARSHKAISETAHCQPAADIAFESFSQNDHGPMQLGDKSLRTMERLVRAQEKRPAHVVEAPVAYQEPVRQSAAV